MTGSVDDLFSVVSVILLEDLQEVSERDEAEDLLCCLRCCVWAYLVLYNVGDFKSE